MKPTKQLQTENAKANQIWRFYSDAAHQWRWERLAFDGTVLEHSGSGYPHYEGCLANACESGYVSLPSLSTRPEKALPKTKRSYVRLSGK